MQNDLEFLRIRSMKQEIMVAPRKLHCLTYVLSLCEQHHKNLFVLADAEFVLIVIQDLKSEA